MPLERHGAGGDARRGARGARALALGGTTLLCSLTLPALAHAQPTTLSIEAPAECSSTAAVEAEIRRLVGVTGDLVVPGARAVTVLLAPDAGGGYRLELRSEGEDGSDAGTRTLVDPSCAALADAAALIVAMMIDPDAALLSAASTPEPPPAAPPPRLVVERAGGLASPIAPPATNLGPPPLALGAGGVLDVGLVATAAGGFFAELVVRIGSFDVRGRVTYLAPAAARASPGTGADVSAVLGTIGGCARPLSDPWLGICVGLEGGALFAQPVGVALPAPGTPAAEVLAASAGLTLPWVPADFVDFEIAAEIVVPLVRPRFEILAAEPSGPSTVVWEPLLAGARVRLAVHFDFRP